MRKLFYIIYAIALIILTSCVEQSYFISSPDGTNSVEVGVVEGVPFYKVWRDGNTVLNKSYLGIEIKDGESLIDNFKIINVKNTSYDQEWEQLWGEEKVVRENYNEIKLTLEQQNSLKRKVDIRFRVFDDGVGFRYEFIKQNNLDEFVLMAEKTTFNFVDNHTSWSIPYDVEAYEGLYEQKNIQNIDTVCTPLTIKTADGLHIAIHEANLTDYAALNLYPIEDNSLGVYLTPWSNGDVVYVTAPHSTPWRIIIIGDNASDLLSSRLMLNLNEPSKIEDESWIKPMKYIGIWWGMHMEKYSWHEGPKHGATTENTMRYMDFAANNNFDAVLVEGWNLGWDNWADFSYTKSYSDFDLEKVTSYGKERGITLIGHHETAGNVASYENQLEDAFALYNKLGVNSVKTGYVGTLLNGVEKHTGQFAVNHYKKVIETAAKYKIMINNHEPVMPTGLQRTYPNLMTQEGVRGQEWNAWSSDGGNPPNHTTIIPFTRGLAGPMDFTPGIFNFKNSAKPNTRVQTTLAKQLALFVVLYSPMQMAADMIESYIDNPEPFEFYAQTPVNWDKTVVTNAEIGEYLVIARKDRDSENWYIGAITNEDEREITIPMTFLENGSDYEAKLYTDGEDAHYKDNPYPINIYEERISSTNDLNLTLKAGGGAAIILEKIE